jgi:hypothetical protein
VCDACTKHSATASENEHEREHDMTTITAGDSDTHQVFRLLVSTRTHEQQRGVDVTANDGHHQRRVARL